jgi:glycogen(starch) synthase
VQTEQSTAGGRLEIGIFIALLPPEHLGGAELQADRLARELAARGHRVHIFTRAQPGRARNEEIAGVRIHRRPVVPVPGLRLLGEIAFATAQAARVRPDILLCYMTLNSGLLGAFASARCGAPFIIWQRAEGESLVGVSGLQRRLAFVLNRRAARIWVQAPTFVGTIEKAYTGARRAAEWHELAGRVRVVGNGLDVPEVRTATVPPPWRMLFVGRLEWQKDLPTLIAAARLVPECEISIAGGGGLRSQLEADARGTRVQFLGAQEHARIAELLRESRGLVLCSVEEGLPNVVLEAFAAGRPVIATPAGAVADLVRDGVNGLIVPMRDPVRLAAAMRELCNDARWRALAAQARPTALAFGWPQLVTRVEAELAAAVQQHSGSRP